MDLSCTPPETEFSWFQMGMSVQFIDETTWNGPDRGWLWSFGGPADSIHRNPLIDFENYGTYEVTMEVTTETGTSSVTKTVEVFEQPGLSGPTRQSGRRVAP